MRSRAFLVSACCGIGRGSDCPTTMEGLDPEAVVFDLSVYAAHQNWATSTNGEGFREVEIPLSPQINVTLVQIPAGPFLMGSPEGRGDRNERPLHPVNLSEFWIAKVPVTYAAFAQFEQDSGYKSDMVRGLKGDCKGCFVFPAKDWSKYVKKQEAKGLTPCTEDVEGCKEPCDCDAWEPKRNEEWNQTSSFDQRDTFPVTCTSWNDARAFGIWMTKQTGIPNLVLPSEAQWMKAALGTSGDGREYPWGSELPGSSHANFADASFVRAYGQARPFNDTVDDGWAALAPVGSYPQGASPYGIMDLVGQGHEWAFDWMDDKYYGKSEACNPLGPSPDSAKPPKGANGRVNLGGAWNSNEGFERGRWVGGDNLRIRSRQGDEPDSADDHATFRLVFDPFRPTATMAFHSAECRSSDAQPKTRRHGKLKQSASLVV